MTVLTCFIVRLTARLNKRSNHGRLNYPRNRPSQISLSGGDFIIPILPSSSRFLTHVAYQPRNLQEQIGSNTEPMRQPLGDSLADRTLAVQDIRDTTLGCAVDQIFLLKSMLLH